MFGIESQLRGLILVSTYTLPSSDEANLSVCVARKEAIQAWLCTEIHFDFPNNFRLSGPYDAVAPLYLSSLALALSLSLPPSLSLSLSISLSLCCEQGCRSCSISHYLAIVIA